MPDPHPIDVFFSPRTIAVIGATEEANSFGRAALWNLISSPFGGTVYPVNPRRRSVLGVKAYPTIGDIPEPIDIAMIVTPASTVPGVVAECAAAGVKGAIIVASGFRGGGPTGSDLEQQALAAAQQSGMRLMGPNSLGLIRPRQGLNASCARTLPLAGSVAFVSHSAALATAVLDWSVAAKVGFSHFISLGSMLDVNWSDTIDYLGGDPGTESILIYMESVGNARAFLSAAREAALTKPIVILKAGRTEESARAAVAHTGNLVESDAVFDAALRRCGALRVSSITNLFAMAELLARQPRPRGPRLAIVTNAGGPGVLAADTLLLSGGQLAPLAPETIAALDAALPATWGQANPIDLQSDASPERYDQAVEIVARDKNADGLLVILTPTIQSNPTRTAELLQRHSRKIGKPLLASWMGGEVTAEGEAMLQRAGVPAFDYPDTAARAFQSMWQGSENLRSLYETPTLLPDDAVDHEQVAVIIDLARTEGRTVLDEIESKTLLAAYGLPVCETHAAADADAAVAHAEQLGYPVVLKLLAVEATHKTDYGGVRLDLRDAEAVRTAYEQIIAAASQRGITSRRVAVQPMIRGAGYELILGSSVDVHFGPVVVFGAGGDLVEILRDRAIGLPPLNTTLARRMMEQTRIFGALPGVRGRAPVDLAALERIVVGFSQLVADQPTIKEIDINPLYVEAGRILALDARVILHDAALEPAALPRLAIRPYPAQYITQWALRDGTPVTIRPIRPEDEPLMVDFHKALSEQSVYYRFFRSITFDRRIEHERLARVCFLDYDRELALVAVQQNSAGNTQIIGVGRLSHQRDLDDAEFALLIADGFQGHGLGTELLTRLVDIGRREGFRRLVAYMLPENRGMIRVSERLGFHIKRTMDLAEATLALS